MLLGIHLPLKSKPNGTPPIRVQSSENIEKDVQRYEMLSQVAGLVVHDLSGPLMAIEYCVEEILRDPSRANSSDIRELLKISSESNLGLVNALRSFVKGSGGRGACSLREGVEASVRIIWMRNMTGGIGDSSDLALTVSMFNFEMDIRRMKLDHMEIDIEVGMDLGDLIHVLVNLVSNAVDAAKTSDSLDRKKGVVVLSIGPGGDGDLMRFLKFDISDNGPGMSQADFDRYTIGGDSGSMGMKLVRGLVESVGGQMKVATAKGGGTCVSVWLPVSVQETKAKSA
jgi:signal transduction histidine kinase